LICILLLVLVACKLPNHQPTASISIVSSAEAGNKRTDSSKTFTNARYGVRIRYPANLELQRTFKRNYLGNGGWKTYMGPDSAPGKPLIALILPGSNAITAGELRIGVSRQPDAIRTCTELPAAALSATKGQTTISGVTFITFEAHDAAMSHYLVTRSYRTVHCGTCYAMDVLVFGTNPKVYEPPAKPPFTKGQVFARLVPVAQDLQFIAKPEWTESSPIALPATYKGLLPCADCPGIAYQLKLLVDHQYYMRLDYQDRNVQFYEHGRWHLSNNNKTLILQGQDEHTSIQQWAVFDGGQRLRLLDSRGYPIRSGLNYDLTRSAQFEPLTSGNEESVGNP
jgi:hypothetical protein